MKIITVKITLIMFLLFIAFNNASRTGVAFALEEESLNADVPQESSRELHDRTASESSSELQDSRQAESPRELNDSTPSESNRELEDSTPTDSLNDR